MVVRHLGFSYTQNFDGLWGLGVEYASSRQISSRSVKPLPRCHDLLIYPKWRPSAILDLLDACLDHPQRVFCSLYRCTKFSCNWCSSFDNMVVLTLYAFGLKTLIHAPKLKFWGLLTPEISNNLIFIPTWHLLALKHITQVVHCWWLNDTCCHTLGGRQSNAFQWAGNPPKFPLSLGGSGLPCNTWLLGPTPPYVPNGILISAAVFAGYIRVTDRQTIHATRQ